MSSCSFVRSFTVGRGRRKNTELGVAGGVPPESILNNYTVSLYHSAYDGCDQPAIQLDAKYSREGSAGRHNELCAGAVPATFASRFQLFPFGLCRVLCPLDLVLLSGATVHRFKLLSRQPLASCAAARRCSPSLPLLRLPRVILRPSRSAHAAAHFLRPAHSNSPFYGYARTFATSAVHEMGRKVVLTLHRNDLRCVTSFIAFSFCRRPRPLTLTLLPTG